MACQKLVVLRHGLRLDEVDCDWTSGASRPWDPPLAPDGIGLVNGLLSLQFLLSLGFLMVSEPGRAYAIYDQPATPEINARPNLREWISFYETRLLGRKLG